MDDFANSTSLCLGSQQCMQWAKMSSDVKDRVSTTLGIISVIVWVVAEIPQLITNYKEKSSEGLSVTFLLTWIIGDLFNLFGCLLEPATLLTQLYTAVLYTIITLSLCLQAIYYGHIYPKLKCNRQLKIDTPTNAEQGKSGMERANDANQSIEFDRLERPGVGLSSPIPLPAHAQKTFVERQLYYQSARYLSKTGTPSTSILGQRSTPLIVNPIQEPLLGSAILAQSAPVLKTKTTLCLVSTLTFLGAFNLLQSPDARSHSMSSKPRQEFVIYVGRKLLQVSGNHLSEHDVVGESSVGTLLGWAMALIYMGGRLPQICLNIRRGNCKGINPLMFLFALIGNVTYVASILVRSLEWSKIAPNLPWLIEPGGCALLDLFILMQYIYFKHRASQGQES
ncbi:probable vacuolar amino acid transporter YPQ1 [Abrus precatorius]|uniref:Probable vacuolar amino acid transporter YPQ1 n=1 Tax=Abrus precatorius TaxID=3816 RepID=A0A8B8LSG1_ABRPR|nr:probable vacuolar amino acid transporter YPQ1 [Abrus precatorius]